MRNALVRGILAAFLLLAYATAKAATISAISGSAADVQAALNLAKAGDTVVMPPGSVNWTQAVVWNAPPNVTLKGAGTSATGGGDETVIVDNYAANDVLLRINASLTGVFRMTGITVKSGSGALKDGGTIRINGPATVRIDHCHLLASSYSNVKMMFFYNGVFGVMDHCLLDFTNYHSLYFFNGRQAGAGDFMGNYEWTLPTNFGKADYFFIEDNIFNGYDNGLGTYASRVFDGFTSAKVVVRFNEVHQTVLGETHATGHAPDDRGTRSQEIYGNKATSVLESNPNYAGIDMENGTSLVWGNDFGNAYKSLYLFKITRIWDHAYSQAPTPTGWGYAGTEFNGTGSKWDGGTAMGTDTRLGYPCLDQPGRGQGDLLSKPSPNKINNTTGTLFWPHQALEPIYIWANAGTVVRGWGDFETSNQTNGRVLPNRDYYPQVTGIQTSPTSPFDGTSGTGWGTLANRPTTCTPGVAYFATDQGSWNTSESNPYGVQQNGADGVLYKCTAPDTWTLYYTPYTYPHPLQTAGGSSPPSPPTGLRIESQ